MKKHIFVVLDCYTDTVFVLDVSGTIAANVDFDNVRIFVKTIINRTGVSETGNRVAVATFSDNAMIEVYCDKNDSSESLEKKVDNIKSSGTLTNMLEGITEGYKALKMGDCDFSRANRRKVMILITDGQANEGGKGIQDLYDKAKQIRDQDVTIYGIAVGPRANSKSLARVTGSDYRVFKPANFEALIIENNIQNILNSLKCQPVSTTTKTIIPNMTQSSRTKSMTPSMNSMTPRSSMKSITPSMPSMTPSIPSMTPSMPSITPRSSMKSMTTPRSSMKSMTTRSSSVSSMSSMMSSSILTSVSTPPLSSTKISSTQMSSMVSMMSSMRSSSIMPTPSMSIMISSSMPPTKPPPMNGKIIVFTKFIQSFFSRFRYNLKLLVFIISICLFQYIISAHLSI